MAAAGLRHRLIDHTPWAIIDIETTGLRPPHDRIVELAVVRIEPDGLPRLAMDTLVNPQRRMSATDIHGITDSDVAGAPTFRELAEEVAACVSGCIVAAYNVYFDLPFIHSELQASGIKVELPHVCLMYLRPMLGLGSKCSLIDACAAHSVSIKNAHCAAGDAHAAAELARIYLAEVRRAGVRTFHELAGSHGYAFLSSLDLNPLAHKTPCQKPRCVSRLSQPPAARSRAMRPLAEYWSALCTVLMDLVVDAGELQRLAALQTELRLTHDQVRALHARAFSNIVGQFLDDSAISDKEAIRLHRLWKCLETLGWAPGQA